MKISMLMYPDFTPLDLMGPLQIWTMFPDADIQLVSKSLAPVTTDTPLTLNPTHTFDSAFTAPDILFAPGGTQGTLIAAEDAETLAFMSDRGANAGWITSVCTGALIIGAAGLLKGYQATTHWAAVDMLAAYGADPVSARWVIDRNRASGGGVTAGIDFGLALMAEIAGEPVAKAAQLAVEYRPQPPFSSGHPEEADQQTIANVMAQFSQTDFSYTE